MLESVFRFLFKYERLVFEQGQFVFGATRSMWLVAAAGAAATLYVLWTYWTLGSLKPRARSALYAIRFLLVAIALFAILRPMLLLKVAVPQQNFVGVLIDDSRSMQLSDEQGRPRSDYVKEQLGTPAAPLLAQIQTRFVPRVFRFSSSAERLQSSADLTFQGSKTRLADAVDRAREEMSGLPVAGLVVVSDGADNGEQTLDQSISALKAAGMPVFSVGVGKDRLSHDVQITRVETPARALKGSSLVVDMVVTQTGYAGAKVPVIVEDSGRTISTQDITLPPDGESSTVKVRFKVADPGPHVFHFRIPQQSGEEVDQNNQRDALIDVYNTRARILYLEGEPRFEAKFILQAVKDDDNLHVALLQRTAEATAAAPDKFYRQGIDGPEELQNGFPATREELFSYQGIILGTVEASAFSPEQQRMLEEFVNVRGGGVLALGGDRSFSEGGWAGTPLADTLPITLDPRAKPLAPPYTLTIRPTRAGEMHPATQITDKQEDADAKWKELPALTAVNVAPTSSLKPGGTTLLTGLDDKGHEQIVLAYQRYGRGKTIVLPVQDTWLWRMDPKVDSEDKTHHGFWQRLARWLVDGVPDRVMVTASPQTVEKGDPVTLTADVRDPEYKGVDDGHITAHVTDPSGKVEDVPLEWTVENPGEYRGHFTPSDDGLFSITVDGTSKDGHDAGKGSATLRVAPSEAEYFDAAMRAPLLTRLAEDTGGRFFRASDTSQLVDAISYSGKGVTVVEERDLWDMPALFLLLLGLMGAEWLFRRRVGLA